MQQVIAAIVTTTFGGLGFLILRWMRREAIDEAIARKLKLVTLYQRMTSAGLDSGELRRLELEIAQERSGPDRGDDGERRVSIPLSGPPK